MLLSHGGAKEKLSSSACESNAYLPAASRASDKVYRPKKSFKINTPHLQLIYQATITSLYLLNVKHVSSLHK